MSQDKKEIIGVRTISTAFIVFALTIFKPFGLAAWQWQMYVHVLAFFLIGFSCCLITEGTLKYIVKKPRSTSLVSNPQHTTGGIDTQPVSPLCAE